VSAPALPPGPSWSQLEAGLRWAFRPVALLEGCRRRYGDVFTVNMAPEGQTVFLSNPDDLRILFTADPAVVRAGEGRRILGPFLGAASLVALDGDEHMRQRKLVLPAFHGSRLAAYRDLIAEVTRAHVERWPRGEPLELAPRFRAIALDVIVQAIFGVREEQRAERLRGRLLRLLDWVGSPLRLLPLLVLGPERVQRLGVIALLRAPVDRIVDEEVRTRRAELARGRPQSDDVLAMLLEARDAEGRGLTDAELRDQLVTMLVAGHETTAGALSWAVERIARMPDVRRRAAEDEAYAEAVAWETLRLRPVLPVISRMLRGPLELTRHTLPPDVTVCACPLLAHRRPDLYPDPYAFRPERFLDHRPGTYEWIPFGGGIRRCVGASFAVFEMKTILTEMLRHVRPEAPSPMPERIGRRSITLVPNAEATVTLMPARQLRRALDRSAAAH
jgi:cytochrome P450